MSEETTIGGRRYDAAGNEPAPPQPGAGSGLPSSRAAWAGRVVSGFAVIFLIFEAAMKFLMPPETVEAIRPLGWAADAMFSLGIIQVICLAIYLAPRTAVIGAVLWTGYLGGAIATHARVGHPLFSHTLFPLYVAVFLWAGLWLRDARVRAMYARVPFLLPRG